MEVLHLRCAGLDVHKKTVVASVRLAEENRVTTEVKTFATTTAGLLALSDWLSANDCTHVAMEATGVYWRPVWHVLSDGEFQLILANAAHVKNVPGRKTDVSDAAWLAELLAHGLIRASFVPDGQTQELRDLLRTRKQLVRERSRHTQRIHKVLEDANLKIDAELSDMLGKSGRAILDALVAGETDAVRLAALAHRNVKSPQAKLAEALRGRVTRHHRFLLQTPSAADRWARCLTRRAGPRNRSQSRALLHRRRHCEHPPRHQQAQRRSHRLRDRRRHESLRHRGSSVVVGSLVPAQRRERRQASVEPASPRRALAQNHPRPMRPRRQKQTRKLLSSPIPASAQPTRTAKSHLRCRRLHSHRHLPYAQERNRLSGPRCRPLLSALQRNTRKELTQTPRAHGLCRTNYAARRLIAVAP